MLIGIVTENLDSYRVLDFVEERIGDTPTRIEGRRVISYGIALLVDQLADWLDPLVSHQEGTAHHRLHGGSSL
jgi:hypothetical protein